MRQVSLISPETKQTIEKKKVAAYCRVSSNSADQLNSYANQIKFFKSYVTRHPGWELVDIFADEGLTGTKATSRTEFQRMMKLCELKKIDLIVTKSISRFARNTKDALAYVRKLKLLGIGVIFEEQGINTLMLGDEMLLSTFAAIAQEESVSISQNLRLSIVKRMEDGSYVDSNAPYGFRLVNKQLTEYPPESEVVKRIFRDYLCGRSATEIARNLEQEGIKTKNGNRKWKSTTITYLLSNERYIGDCLYQKTYRSTTVPFKQSKNRANEDQFYADNTHTGFIDRDTFDKVQNLLAKRKQKHLKTDSFNTYPLTSLIHCAECGSSFRRRIKSGGVAWACSKHVQDKTVCDSHYYHEERIYHAFMTVINKLRFGNHGIIEEMEANLQTAINIAKRANNEARSVSSEIAELNTKLLLLEQLHSKGYLASDAYQSQSNEINRKITVLKSKRNECFENELEQNLKDIKTLHNLLEAVAEPMETFDERLFSETVKSIYINRNDQITFILLGNLSFSEQM